MVCSVHYILWQAPMHVKLTAKFRWNTYIYVSLFRPISIKILGLPKTSERVVYVGIRAISCV